MHLLERGLSVHRNTEPNLHHTGGVKASLWASVKKGKMKQEQHRKSIEKRREMENRERNTE